MTECADDLALIAATRAGATEAFGQLVERHQDRLFATVARLCGSSADAADILQDAFVLAYRKLHTFHAESTFYTWVYRIAVNLAMSHRRKARRIERHETLRPLGTERLDPPSVDDPSLPLIRAEQEREIQQALASLDPPHRAVVVMRDLDGLPYDEIARLLDVPIGTVRSRLHRARLHLRDKLRPVAWLDSTVPPEPDAPPPASHPRR